MTRRLVEGSARAARLSRELVDEAVKGNRGPSESEIPCPKAESSRTGRVDELSSSTGSSSSLGKLLVDKAGDELQGVVCVDGGPDCGSTSRWSRSKSARTSLSTLLRESVPVPSAAKRHGIFH